MIYGYARVSTKHQATDGNSLEAQEKTLRENGAEIIFSDSFTGTKADRPELARLLAQLKPNDTLIVTKLDRIARSVSQGSALITELINKDIKINIINLGIMDNTPASKLIRNVFFAFAEFERDMIVEQTREGREIARRDPSYREGRPKKFNNKQMAHALELLNTRTYRQVCDMTGISKSTLIRAKRKIQLQLKSRM